MKAAVAAEAELRPKVAVIDRVPGPVAKLVVEPVSVVVEPMETVARILAEPVEPKEVVLGISAGMVASMVVEAVYLPLMALPMGPGSAAAALVLEADPKLVAFAERVAALEAGPRVAEPVAEVALVAGPRVVGPVAEAVVALEAGPRVDGPVAEAVVALEAGPRVAEPVAEPVVALEAGPMVVGPVDEAVVALEAGPRLPEHVSGPVLVLEADSRMAEFEGSKCLWGVEAGLGSVYFVLSPKVTVAGTDLEVVPVVALELDARNWLMLVVTVIVLVPRWLQVRALAAD